MGAGVGFEPLSFGEAKSLANADLVDGKWFRTGRKKQRKTGRGKKKQQFWQPFGNLQVGVKTQGCSLMDCSSSVVMPWSDAGAD